MINGLSIPERERHTSETIIGSDEWLPEAPARLRNELQKITHKTRSVQVGYCKASRQEEPYSNIDIKDQFFKN